MQLFFKYHVLLVEVQRLFVRNHCVCSLSLDGNEAVSQEGESNFAFHLSIHFILLEKNGMINAIELSTAPSSM